MVEKSPFPWLAALGGLTLGCDVLPLPQSAAPAYAKNSPAAAAGVPLRRVDRSGARTFSYYLGPPDPLPDCETDLARAGVTFRKSNLAVHTENDPKRKVSITCGAPQVVTYMRGPGKITYSSPPLLSCAMALALASFERLLQEEAERVFHTAVTRIDHLGTYSCREVSTFPGVVSEHAYANAMDVNRFTLKTGQVIDVLRDFELADPPKKPAGTFLRGISRRANDEEIFSHVLTPFYNATHKNHFHLDLARYHADGTRPRS